MTSPDDSSRPLTALGATAVVIANMVGTGVFTTTGYLASDLGHPGALLGLWLLGGLLALCGALIYAELGAMFPQAGGEYVYLSRAFSPALGFLSGWVSLWVGFSAPVAISARAFALYVDAALGGGALPIATTGVLLIATFTALHAGHVLWGSRVHSVLTASKVALIALLIVAGFAGGQGRWQNLTVPAPWPAPGPLAVGLVLISFAYQGWNAAAYVAGEIRDPGRNLPRALLLGTAIVTVLYLGLNALYLYAAPPAALAAEPQRFAAVVMTKLFGGGGARVLSGLVALVLLSSVSSMILVGPRVYLAMAQDGLFFRAFARRDRHGTPAAAVLLQGTLSIAMLVALPFEALMTYVGFTLGVFSVLTVLAAFVLRRRRPDLPRPYRAFAFPLTGAAFILLSVLMIGFSVRDRPGVSLAGAATLVSGLLVYAFFRRPRKA